MDPANPDSDQYTKLSDKISSNHPGVVVVSYCDGRSATLNTNIEQVLYMQLMAPCDREVNAGTDATNLGPVGIQDPLNLGSPAPALDQGKLQ